MPTTENIARAMQGTSPTNGWDAVFAIDLQQANALFFQEFLDASAATVLNPAWVGCALSDETSMWILDLQLGPPNLSLCTGATNATVGMDVIAGALVSLDPTTLQILSAAWLRPTESS